MFEFFRNVLETVVSFLIKFGLCVLENQHKYEYQVGIDFLNPVYKDLYIHRTNLCLLYIYILYLCINVHTTCDCFSEIYCLV